MVSKRKDADDPACLLPVKDARGTSWLGGESIRCEGTGTRRTSFHLASKDVEVLATYLMRDVSTGATLVARALKNCTVAGCTTA
jgi:hypothetical protein